MDEEIEERLKKLERNSHPPVTPIVSAEEFDNLKARVDRLEDKINYLILITGELRLK